MLGADLEEGYRDIEGDGIYSINHVQLGRLGKEVSDDMLVDFAVEKVDIYVKSDEIFLD